jgi:hypothetical protein
MLKLYGFSKVNAIARGHTRDLRVLWAGRDYVATPDFTVADT